MTTHTETRYTVTATIGPNTPYYECAFAKLDDAIRKLNELTRTMDKASNSFIAKVSRETTTTTSMPIHTIGE